MRTHVATVRRAPQMPIDKPTLDDLIKQRERKVNFSIRVRPSMKARIKQLAKARGLTPSKVIDVLLEAGVPEFEREWGVKK